MNERFIRELLKEESIRKSKVSIIKAFASKISEVITLGYQSSRDISAYDEFSSNVLRRAIKGDYPNFEIDYRFVKVARGYIQAPFLIVGELGANNLILQWHADLDSYQFSKSNDKLVLLLINKSEDIIFNNCVGCRNDEKAVIPLPENFRKEFNAWVFYHNPFNEYKDSLCNVSDSVYLGRFEDKSENPGSWN